MSFSSCLNEKGQILCPNKNLCDRQMEIDEAPDQFKFYLFSWMPHFNCMASLIVVDGVFHWQSP